MLKVENKRIGGMDFQFSPMPVLKAARLDKKVIGLIIPIITGFGGIVETLFQDVVQGKESDVTGDATTMTDAMHDILKDLDFDRISSALIQSFDSLRDEELQALILGSLYDVTATVPGHGAVEITTEASLDIVFSRKLSLMYQVMFESWRYNKFTPFAVLDLIGAQETIDGLDKGTEKHKSTGLKLVRSVSSTQN